jgi:hypothetical protein
MREGYTVRDRNLLNNLLLSGQNLSYKEIGEKIETDIIIEIISITSEMISANDKKVELEERKLSPDFEATYRLDAENFTVDCKIILVNDGTTAGMLTLWFRRCLPDVEQCLFTLTLKKDVWEEWWSSIIFSFQDETKPYGSLTWNYKLDTIAHSVASTLVGILRAN